ncbi:protein broad-minded-like [Palaemon carinicauda]|uniref:protein broad-minded-like n=1 Tax=Palaemon carinicauda TaxID=392227 RepID=UPI0035B695A9
MAGAKMKISQEPAGSKVQIKDLLAHMDPMIYLAGTADNTSEMLAYVADMDPAFHKLELVKGLRKELRSRLGQAIENRAVDYLEQHKGKMRADNPVDVLVERIKGEEIYNNFVNDMGESVKKAVQDISEHFDDEIVTGMFSHEEDELAYNASPNGSNESSLNSSLNQSGLLFLHPAQYNNIAQGLLSKKDSHAWNEGLNILISVTPGEPVMQDCWPDLKKGLRDCLLEESHEVFGKSLKVHCKLLTSQVQNAVKEAYLNLLEAVAGFYMSKKHLSKIPLKGEKVDLKPCGNIIRILKVITDFQKELPLLWIRYPERYVDDMVESTFSVLSLHVGKRDSTIMNVLDMLSFVDCDVFWFRRWVHGQWGRNKTFSAMKSNSTILLYLVSYCIQYLENCPETIDSGNSSSLSSSLSSSMVSFLRFIQNFKLIMAIISSSDGRKLFPVNVPSREELVTVQGMIQMFIKASCDSKMSKEVVMEIRNQLQKYCSRDEVRSWILCDAGAVETLLHEVSCLEDFSEKKDRKGKDETNISPLFLKTVLSILQSILSTQVGQRYILLGRKRKASSKSGLSTVTKRQAYEVMDLIHFVLRSEKLNVHLKKRAVSVCCFLLSSPIGIHMCLGHPLIESVIGHLQKNGSKQPKNLSQGEDLKMEETLCLNESQSLPLLSALLSTYKGISLLESEGILSLVLKQVLPQMAKNGKINQKILSCVCTSFEGSSVIGELGILLPYWEIICLATAGEEPGQQPQKEEDKEETLMATLAPLLSVTGTYHGAKLLFSEGGLLSHVSHYLFSLDETQEELHRMALYILGSATSSLDSMVCLQTSTNYQEQLLAQQSLFSVDDGSAVIIDENSIIRNHILVKSYLLGGSGERILPPLIIDSTSSIMPQLFSSYPPPKDYIPEKPIRSMHKKQNEVWRFLSDTRHGLHDIGWLNHCRKAVRSVVVAGEDIKNWLVMDIIERSVRILLASTEELLPGSPLSDKSTTGTSVAPTSPSSSPSSDSGQIPMPPEYSAPQSTAENLPPVSEAHLAAVELVLRYGSELQLLTGSGGCKDSLLEVLSFTQSKILCSNPERCDWFVMVMFLISGGNVERCRNVLSHISGLLVGGILWPCFSDSLSVTHELLPGEVTFSGIIHNAQLVLSIEIPMLFSVIQANSSCIWNIIGEWIRCLFLGVLPWIEVCHYVIMVLLQGPDYAVYFIVAFLRHLQKIIIKYTGNHKCLTLLQTSTITGWRIGEHLSFMEGLSRRHRRTVLPALISSFYNLRHECPPRQL